MKLLQYILIAAIFIALVWISERDRIARERLFRSKLMEIHSREQKLLREMDSLQHQYDYLVIHYRNVSEAYRHASQEALKYQNLYERQRKKKLSFDSDSDYDSVLNVLYPR